MNVQDKLELTASGVYATAGVNIANNFMRNPVFRIHNVSKAYKERGHNIESVRKAWNSVDLHEDREIADTMRFWCNASTLDPVVWYPIVKHNLKPLIQNGSCVLQRSTALFHTATINEMAKHIAEATEVADSLRA
jgi:hypothetical protein